MCGSRDFTRVWQFLFVIGSIPQLHACLCAWRATSIKAKIAEAEKAKVHTMLVIGGRDMDAGQVSVRLHSKGPQGAKAKGEVVAEILVSIKERTA